jgi:hypothetical protein
MRQLAACLALTLLAACSTRGVYEGIQTSNRQECGMLPPSQYDECMERNALSYEEYERERKAAAEQPER